MAGCSQWSVQENRKHFSETHTIRLRSVQPGGDLGGDLYNINFGKLFALYFNEPAVEYPFVRGTQESNAAAEGAVGGNEARL